MLREVIRSVREKYPTLDIVALIDKDNRKSLCLLKKLGFRQECYADSIASFVYVLSAWKSPRRKYRGLFLFRKLCYTEKNTAGEYYVN